MSSPTSELIDQYFVREKGELELTMIRAGAGAGKTTELVRRVLSIAIVQKAKTGEWPRLVVTTFTRKATQELRERLVQGALALTSLPTQELFAHRFSDLSSKGLLEYVQSSQNLHISTIHGILSIYLKKYGSEIGLQPDFQLLDSRQTERLLKQTLAKLLKSSSAGSFLEDFEQLREYLTQAQLEEFVTSLHVQKVDRGGRPFGPLLARDMQIIFDQQFQEVIEKSEIVLQSFGAAKLTEAWQTREQSLQSFLSSKNAPAVRLGKLLEQKTGSLRASKEISADLVQALREVYETAGLLSGTLFAPETRIRIDDLNQRFDRLGQVWMQKFETEKIDRNSITIEDLELLAVRLTEEYPSTAKRFKEEWDYWLIDEYQDTSPRQVKLIQNLTHDRKKFLVGDPQQSIYLFRGARAEVFHEAAEQVKALDGKYLEQMTNYRTEAEILGLMNELMTQASSQLTGMNPGKKINPGTFTQMSLWPLDEAKKKERKQVEGVVQQILKLVSSGARYDQICVISRKKADLKAIAGRAQELRIPCQMHTSGEYFQRPEVQDAMRVLKFMVNPDDNENLVGLLRSPWLELSDQEIYQMILQEKKKSSFWQLLRERGPSATHQILQELLVDSQEMGFGLSLRKFLVARGFFDEAFVLDPSGRREANLWKLVQSLILQERRPGFQPLDFFEQAESISIEDAVDADASPVVEPNRVQLMTVHGSKGLQFPHVLVPYLDDSAVDVDRVLLGVDEDTDRWTLGLKDVETHKLMVFPSFEKSYREIQRRGLEEIDRVFYVAITRAQQSIHLFWNKNDDGKWTQVLQSFADRAATLGSPLLEVCELAEGTRPAEAVATEVTDVRVVYSGDAREATKAQTYSVTRLLEKKQSSAMPVIALVKQEGSSSFANVARVTKGTHIHRVYENLKYGYRPEDPSKDEVQALAFIETPELQFFNSVVQSGEVEWGFVAKIQQSLVQGQIDLWGRDADGNLWIIDYKTGSVERSASAFEQLKIYSWALGVLQKKKPQEKVFLAALFPFDSKFLFEPSPPQEDLEKMMVQKISEQ